MNIQSLSNYETKDKIRSTNSGNKIEFVKVDELNGNVFTADNKFICTFDHEGKSFPNDPNFEHLLIWNTP